VDTLFTRESGMELLNCLLLEEETGEEEDAGKEEDWD
jgi:hypothetical protein